MPFLVEVSWQSSIFDDFWITVAAGGQLSCENLKSAAIGRDRSEFLVLVSLRPDSSRKKEEIEKAKNAAIASNNPDIKKAALDSLAAYGKIAASSIMDVVNDPGSNDDVKAYGFSIVKQLRS
jgi:hypothetical protein